MPKVNAKDRFYGLATNDRRRIAYAVAIISLVHIVQFAIAPPDTTFGRGGGIGLNALALLWSVRPQNAPRFWFELLPYAWLIAAVFDGREVFLAFQQGQAVSVGAVLSMVNVLILPVWAAPLLRFYQMSESSPAIE